MVKVISLSNDAYAKLKAIKNGKSFSEVVVELVDSRKKDKKDIMKFAGVFAKNKDKWEEKKKEIYKDREKFKLRDFKL